MGRGITERSNRKRAMNHNGADPRMVGARFILTGSSQVSQHHECLCRWRENAHTKSLAYILTRSVWPPLLVWLLPACRVKKMAFHTLLSFHFPILLFRHSSSLSYSRFLSFTLILLLTTLFSVSLAGCCSVAAPKRGPFCWNSFGGIKKGARTTPPPQLYSSSLNPLFCFQFF